MPSNQEDQRILRERIRISNWRPDNRFAGEFVPEPEAHKEFPLVYEALHNLKRERKSLIRVRSKYQMCTIPKAMTYRYRVEAESGNHKSDTEVSSSQSPSSTKVNVVDLFNAPTDKEDAHSGEESLTRSPVRQSLSQRIKNMGSLSRNSKKAREILDKGGPEAEIDSVAQTEHENQKKATSFYVESLDPSQLVDSDYLKSSKDGMDAIESLFDQHQVDNLLWRYHPDFEYIGPLETVECNRRSIPLWKRDLGTQLLVSIDKLSLGIDNIEPYFCTLALYDLRRDHCGKLSESFHFDLNPDGVLTSTLSVWRYNADEITLCRNAIFSIPDRHEGIYLILRVEKVLQGDFDSAADPYLKEKELTRVETDKLAKKVKTTINRLADYRQSFVFGLCPLFNDIGGLALENVPGTENDAIQSFELTFDKLFLDRGGNYDEESFLNLAREYAELLHESNSYFRKKVLPFGKCLCTVRELDDGPEEPYPLNVVDPSLIPLKPPKTELTLQESKTLSEETVTNSMKSRVMVREIETFSHIYDSSQSIPFSHFVNSLYVYPLKVSFQKYRNLACRIQLRTIDVDLNAEGTKTLFGKSSSNAFIPSLTTNVTYHNKSPNFNDEFKIILPLQLTQKTHLFFTFYQVACQKKPGKPVQEVIGYACLPIFKENRLIVDGDYVLPVAANLPDHYLSKYEERKDTDEIQFRPQSQSQFQLRLRSLSSIFTQDYHLNELCKCIEVNQPNEVLFEHAKRCNAKVLVQFLPVVLNYLFRHLCAKDQTESIQDGLYHCILWVCNGIQQVSEDPGERPTLLVSYVEHIFDTFSNPKTCTILLGCMVRSLQHLEEDEQNITYQLVLRHAWFSFECIVKSIVCAQLEDADTSLQSFHSFVELLPVLVDCLCVRMIAHRSVIGHTALKWCNSSLALFFHDLYSVLPFDTVTDLIIRYFEGVEPHKDSVLLDFQMKFLSILLDSEYFLDITGVKKYPSVPLNDFSSTDSSSSVLHSLSKYYPLIAMAIRFVDKYFTFGEKTVRGRIINVIRKNITKHSFNASYTPEIHQSIATMFVPFLQVVGDRIDEVESMSLNQKKDVLILVIWIIQTSDRKLLNLYLQQEDELILSQLLRIATNCASTFEYKGRSLRTTAAAFVPILSTETTASLLGQDATEFGDDFKTNIEALMTTLRKTTGANASQGPTQMLASTTGGSTGLRSSTKVSLRQRRAQMAAAGSLRRQKQVAASAAKNQTLNSSTMRGNDMLRKLLELEAAVNALVAVTLVRFCGDCACVLDKYWQNPSHHLELCNSMILLSHALLEKNIPDRILMSVYPVLHTIIELTCSFWKESSTLSSIGDVSRQLLRHGTYSLDSIRSHTSSLLYRSAVFNYQQKHQVVEFLEQISIGLSKMVSQLDGERSVRLEQVLSAIVKYSKLDNQCRKECQSEIENIIVRLLSILGDTREIVRVESLGKSADSTVYQDLLYAMASSYSHLPAARVEWLEQLVSHHDKQANHAESALCTLEVISIIENELQNESQRIPDLLKRSCIALDKAQLYEKCNEVYQKLIPFLADTRQFDQLSRAHLHLHQVFASLDESIKTESRLLGSYYRVGFYGKDFGTTLDHRQFIYKMPKITRLAEMVDYLKQRHGTAVGGPSYIRILPDSRPIEEHNIQEDEHVLQVTYVQPYYEDREQRQYEIDKKTNLQSFMYSTPFIKGGNAKKAHANDITLQQKCNTILNVSDPFPWILTRQPIVNVEQHILSPVASARENVMTRVEKICEVLSSSSPDTKVLSNVLQGSVMLQVHGGAVEITEAFFKDASAEEESVTLSEDELPGDHGYNENELNSLRETLLEFLDVCERGIDLFGNGLKGMSEKDKSGKMNSDFILHSELDKHYRKLRSQMMPRLQSKRKKKKRKNVRFLSRSKIPTPSVSQAAI